MKRKIVLATTAAAIAGIAIYLAVQKRNAAQNKKRKRHRDKYLTNVFSHGKRYGGTEFVL